MPDYFLQRCGKVMPLHDQAVQLQTLQGFLTLILHGS